MSDSSSFPTTSSSSSSITPAAPAAAASTPAPTAAPQPLHQKVKVIKEALSGLAKVAPAFVEEHSRDGNVFHMKLPKVLVIGSQNHGKSSLLERVAGLKLWPVKDGECTKFKVEVHFHHLVDGAEHIPATVEAFMFDDPNRPVEVKLETAGVKAFDFVQLASDALVAQSAAIDRALIRIRIHNQLYNEMVLVDMPGLTMANIDATASPAEKKAAFEKTEQLKRLAIGAMSDPNDLVVIVHGEDRPDNNCRALELWGERDAAGADMPCMIAVATKVDRWNHETSAHSLRDMLVFGSSEKQPPVGVKFAFPRLANGWFATCGKAIADNSAEPAIAATLRAWVNGGELEAINSMLDKPNSMTKENVDDRIGSLAVKRYLEAKLDEKLSKTWAPTLHDQIEQFLTPHLSMLVDRVGDEPTPKLDDFHRCLDEALKATDHSAAIPVNAALPCATKERWEEELARLTDAIVSNAHSRMDAAPKATMQVCVSILDKSDAGTPVHRFEGLKEHLKSLAGGASTELCNKLAANDVLLAIQQAVALVAQHNQDLAREVLNNFLKQTVASKLLKEIKAKWLNVKQTADPSLVHCCESEQVVAFRGNVKAHALAFHNLSEALKSVILSA